MFILNYSGNIFASRYFIHILVIFKLDYTSFRQKNEPDTVVTHYVKLMP